TPAVLGFGTINEPIIVGQHCEHERITRAAFACPPGVVTSDGWCFEEQTLHQLAGTSEPGGYVGQGSNGAVGAPDMLDPTPEGPEAHCDNADFLDTTALGLKESYPRTRAEATAQLQICTNHLRMRFSEGVDAANKIASHDLNILPAEVDISTRDCRFSFPELQMHIFSRSKCSAIEGFGRALHGIQDFYAHSNWADDASPPFSVSNPPGLKRNDYPAFLDLRAENNITDEVPQDLSTGCFGGIMTDGPVGKAGHPLEPGSLDCTGRITHHTLNKDNGVIDEVTGHVSRTGPNTPRSDIAGNFQRAVFAAIHDSRRQWRHFREEIRRTYGTERGNILICALVRDNPTTDCYGRRVAILRDVYKYKSKVAVMSIPTYDLLAEGIGIKNKTERNETFIRKNQDQLTLKPAPHLADPGEPTDLPLDMKALDLGTALDELLRDNTPLPQNKTSIIALASDHEVDMIDQIANVMRAGDEGIRVHLGILPPATVVPAHGADNELARLQNARAEDLVTAVLRTGGTYSILHSEDSISPFLSHVISRGLTHYDNAKDTATLLLPGLSINDYVTPKTEPRRYSF
ncbi:hypothetical protein B0J11DRAFT_412251, partial [Dendryphion nanum]